MYFIIKDFNFQIDEVKLMNNLEGFIYNIRSSSRFLGVNKLNITSSDISSKLIYNSFNKSYKKILKLFLEAQTSDEDSSEGNLIAILNEIVRLRGIIKQKYMLALKKKDAKEMLEKLSIIENKIKSLIVDIRIRKEERLVNNRSQVSKKSM